MCSKAGRSNCCLMSLDAKVYAVSKSPRRKASSCFMTGSAASFGAGFGVCAHACGAGARRHSASPIQSINRIRSPLTNSALASPERLSSNGGPLYGRDRVTVEPGAVHLDDECRPLKDLHDR